MNPKVPRGPGSIVRGRLPSRVRRAICRDAMESNAKERRSAPGYPLAYRNCRESLLPTEVHRHDSGNLADFTAKLCRNSLARKRPGVRISSAPHRRFRRYRATFRVHRLAITATKSAGESVPVISGPPRRRSRKRRRQ